MSVLLDQINRIINDFMNQAKQALSHIIVSLESDQLIQQMRNDPSLYQQKINYINQIIKDQFSIDSLNEKLVAQIAQLSEAKKEIQLKIEQSKQEYICELSNIQVQYKQFLLEKENQKKSMQKLIEQKQHQFLMFKKQSFSKWNILQRQNQSLKKQIQILKTLQKNYKIDIEESEKIKEKLNLQLKQINLVQKSQNQMKLITFNKKISEFQKQNAEYQRKSIDLERKNLDLNQKIHNLEQQIEICIKSEEYYSLTIEKMKDDMHLIKQEWQKKCFQIQSELTEDYRTKLIEHEQQMNGKLKQYMEDLKMGKNVIIQSSQQILQSKRLIMQQKLNSQIKKYQNKLIEQEEKLKLLDLKYNKIKDQNALKQSEIKQTKNFYQSQLKSKELSFNKKQGEINEKFNKFKNETDKQIQRLRKTQSMLLKDLQNSKNQKEQIQKQVQCIREEFNLYKQKQSKETKKFKDLQQLNQGSGTKMLQMKKDLAILNEKNVINQKSIKEKNNEIFRLENSLNSIKNQYKQLDNVARKLQLRLAESSLTVKQHQRIRQQNIRKVDKLTVLARKLSKQLILIKQDISYLINVQKSKFASMLLGLNDQIAKNQSNIIYKSKQKMKDLLDQIEQQKKQQEEEVNLLIRQNENMKKEIKILEQIMQEKQEDHVYNKERLVNLQVQKCRLIMQDQIGKERQEKRKIQEKIYNQQKKHEYLISKAEKEMARNVGMFIKKWECNFAELQQSYQMKDKQLKQVNYQLKKVLSDLQCTKENLKTTQQRLQKQQRKYQSLKNQRDKTVDQMMKRLQKETKHKIALEKQLKEIRGEIMNMKTQSNTNSSPFNNYSFTDRQNNGVYTNAFQSTTHQKMKTLKTNHREKQLSEIREMIAKTYKVVEGPEKDSPIHKSKLF